MTTEPCFACGRRLGKNPLRVDTRDGQTVFVGRECGKHVLAAGDAGWQPPQGGPRLFPMPAPPVTDHSRPAPVPERDQNPPRRGA